MSVVAQADEAKARAFYQHSVAAPSDLVSLSIAAGVCLRVNSGLCVSVSVSVSVSVFVLHCMCNKRVILCVARSVL